MSRYDVRRQVQETDTILGGVTITSTAVETREIDLQHLNGSELAAIGGLRIEAQYKGFTHEDADIREQDMITPDSGTTRYQIVFVQGLWNDHTRFFAKRIQ